MQSVANLAYKIMTQKSTDHKKQKKKKMQKKEEARQKKKEEAWQEELYIESYSSTDGPTTCFS